VCEISTGNLTITKKNKEQKTTNTQTRNLGMGREKVKAIPYNVTVMVS
jgi:hypothetical protein